MMPEPFTQVPNEMLEALARTHLTLYETRVIFVILRQVNGYHKRSDQISLDKFASKTGMNRRHIQRAVKSLELRRIISTSTGYRRCKTYRINGTLSEWRPAPLEARGGEKRLRRPTGAFIGDAQAAIQGPRLAPEEATVLAPLEAPTKETLKEKRKESLKENAPARWPLGATVRASDDGDQEAQARKEAKKKLLNQQRLMMDSGLYSNADLKGKDFEELDRIHTERLKSSNGSGVIQE
jgi:phage replication O-like protein O